MLMLLPALQSMDSQNGLPTSSASHMTLHLIRELVSPQRKCSNGSMSVGLTDLTTITWKHPDELNSEMTY